MQVSVIIPTYKHRDFILQTLASVFAQTFTDYEIIVVNDGSPDDTADVLKPLVAEGKIRYIEQPNAGQAAARNRGIAEAQGEFIALLDDDDLWPPDKLEWQVGLLRDRSEVGIVVGDVIEFSIDLPEISATEMSLVDTLTFEAMFNGNPIISPGQSLIRSAVMERIGGLNTDIWGADDYDLWLRASRVTQIELYNSLGLFYRRHTHNASLNINRMFYNAKKVIDKNLSGITKSDKIRLRGIGYRTLYGIYGSQFAERIRVCIQRKKFWAALGDLLMLFQIIIKLKSESRMRNLLIGKLIR